jgi:hypothetical protein
MPRRQHAAGNSGMADILGLSKGEQNALVKTYNQQKKNTPDKVKPDQLLKDVNDALAALRKCEDEKCPKPEKPAEKKDEKKDDETKVVEEHWPGFTSCQETSSPKPRSKKPSTGARA